MAQHALSQWRLRPYQLEAVDVALRLHEVGKTVVLVMPPGAGKTDVGASILTLACEKAGPYGSVLAHQDVLFRQWAEKLHEVTRMRHGASGHRVSFSPQVNVSRGEDIAIASVFAQKPPGGLAPESFHTVVMDEGHHMLAHSFRRWRDVYKESFLVLLTATPVRGDGVCLTEFGPIVSYLGLRELIEMGHLVDGRFYGRNTFMDVSEVSVGQEGDFHPGNLGQKVDVDWRNQMALEAYLEWGEDEQAIAFCADIVHAESVAERFRRERLAARAIHSKLSRKERLEILEAFREGAIQVLVTCGLLAEGFDCPQVRCVLLLRPFTEFSARVLMLQQVGRTLRTWPGKAYAIVIQLIDQRHSRSCPKVPMHFTGEDGDFPNGQLMAEHAANLENARRARTRQALHHTLVRLINRYEPPSFSEPHEEWRISDVLDRVTGLPFLKLPGGAVFLSLVGGSTVSIAQHGSIFCAVLETENGIRKTLTVAGSQDETIKALERLLPLHVDRDLIEVSNARAKWRRSPDPMTDRQVGLLSRLSTISAGELRKAKLSKGQAERYISSFMALRPKPACRLR
ncbi:MAG: DEAD/DEAH box helicase [Nitrospirae bacterium]|nr:DEAD/DEAH box helicase [Nitrospirota bacterium]